jgi:hypothetical protein
LGFVKAHAVTGWRSLLLWSCAIAGIAFSVVSAASIGIFVAPFAILFTLIMAPWARSWPEAPLGGFFIGPGVICLLVAILSLDYAPCPADPISLAPGQSFSCGGLDPAPWLIAGLVLVVVGLAVYYFFKAVRSQYEMNTDKI